VEPSAAVVVDEDRSGPYATGKSLSFEPALQPLDPSPVKEVRLDASNKLIEIAPGVKYTAWTLGDQVPGPTVRARVGDKIRFQHDQPHQRDDSEAAHRRADAPLDGLPLGDGSPQDLFHSIGPGQTISFEFTPAYPGVFMYHCVTPPMVDHVAAGMYGMTVVEPKGGWPTKADREYVVVQGEFYARLDPERRKVDNFPVYVLDKERALAAAGPGDEGPVRPWPLKRPLNTTCGRRAGERSLLVEHVDRKIVDLAALGIEPGVELASARPRTRGRPWWAKPPLGSTTVIPYIPAATWSTIGGVTQ